MKILALLLCLAASLFGAADGRWNAEFKTTSKKAKPATTRVVYLDLHTSQGALSGNVANAGNKKGRARTIENGKVDGDKISFTTTTKGKKGDLKYTWEGTVQGDQISGVRTREGGKRGQSFVAKRQA